jgi:uncharacterized protein YbgA (DUF1722 family)/uncharacterized protein YbbK (DUF523 family)
MEPFDGTDRLRIGVSACLIGQPVRFDGGHKRHGFTADGLARHAELVPICPEVAIGLGAPRATLRLEGGAGRPRLVSPATGQDMTDRMTAWAARALDELSAADLDGFILKRGSPTCGMERVRRYPVRGAPPLRDAAGLWAAALVERFPDLPVEEEGRLSDPVLRESFVERLFAYRRVRRLLASRWTAGDLMRFHTGEKLLLLAHDERRYRELGRLVAAARHLDPATVAAHYLTTYMRALGGRASRRSHTNVLQHMAGHFKRGLALDDRAELHQAIAEYRRGWIPLVVPIALVRHHARRQRATYLLGQRYLDPHPPDLMLRNHI